MFSHSQLCHIQYLKTSSLFKYSPRYIVSTVIVTEEQFVKMDEQKSETQLADEPREGEKKVSEENLEVPLSKNKSNNSEDYDLYLKRMAERSRYMKRLSNKSKSSRISDKTRPSSSIGKKRSSKEHIIKAIERKVMQMTESKEKNMSYVPEEPRKISDQRSDITRMSMKSKDLSRRGSVKSKISDFSDRSQTEQTIMGKAMSIVVSENTMSDGGADVDDRNNTLEDEYENIRRMTERSEYMKKMSTKSKESHKKSSKQSTFSKKDIENIMEAIKSPDMLRTESDGAVKLDDESVDHDVRTQPIDLAVEAEANTISEDESKEQKSANMSDSDSDEHNISELNFRISDTELTQLMHQASMKHIGRHTVIHSRTDYMPLSEFERVVKNLYKCCLKSVTDLHELHVRRLLALPIISDIIARADPEYINTAHIIHMIWSVMSCLHHFQLRLKSGSNSLVMYTRQRMLDKCMDYYLQLIRMFKPNVHRIILSAIITFYKDGKLWDIEFACTDMIVALLDIYPDVEDGVNDLLNSAMYSTSINPIEAQKLMQVIYEVLKSVKWRKISRKIIDRLIFMLENSISPKDDNSIYGPLRMGIDLCIRHVINNISNSDVMVVLKRLLKGMVARDVTEQALLNFGSLASHAAARYQMNSFHSNITPDLLFHISLLAREDNKMTFLTAMRIWLNLIDRNRNSPELNQPRIFFRGCQYKILVKKKCSQYDRIFFKAHQNYFYELITDCFRKFSNSRIQMYVLFEMCAVILVEIPCGYTAATFTSIAMSMQEYALQICTENLVKSHYLHATALSILSLICYVHQAEVFYEYITNIIDRRAEWAPHLSPPLKSKYEYALHHVLWNKPELFFEDWEARFGLWKCFRIKKIKKNKDKKK